MSERTTPQTEGATPAGGTTEESDSDPPDPQASTGDDRGQPLRTAGLYAALVGIALLYLIPIETGLMTSIKTSDAVLDTLPFFPPLGQGFTGAHWTEAADALRRGMINSVLFTIPSTLLCAIFGSMAAFGLTLTKWRGQIAMLALFIAGIFIPYQAVIIPLTQFWTNWAPVGQWLEAVLDPDSADYWGTIVKLIVTHTAYGIPICTLLFRAQYKTMSWEMIEAARLDGAGLWRIYRRIVLPLSIPMFSVVFIFQFTQIWNEFLFSLTIIGSSADPAASVTLILGQLGRALEGVNFPLRMAGAFVAAMPTLIVYVLFTDKFAEGVRV